IGLGIEPIKDLKERLGATMKQTLGSYGFQAEGVRTGEDFKQEYGLSSISEYTRTLMENVQASTRLDVFVNFKGVKHIDARWVNQVTAKVNKLISVNFEYERLYDTDLSESAQTRQALTVGISFLSFSWHPGPARVPPPCAGPQGGTDARRAGSGPDFCYPAARTLEAMGE